MQIYLENKEHGKKIAHAVQEAALDKLNGWVEVTEDAYFGRNKEENKEGAKETLKFQAGQKNAKNTNKIS